MSELIDPELCGICGLRESSGQGEHAWSQWFLRDADKGGKPLSAIAINGEPLRYARTGRPIVPETRIRVFFPCCSVCNGNMNRSIEEPAKALIRKLEANNWSATLSAPEWRSVGIWFLKCMLLAGMPQSRYSVTQAHAQFDRAFDNPPPDVRWLGKLPLEVPPSMSVFVHRTHRSASFAAGRRVLVLPAASRTPSGSVQRIQSNWMTGRSFGVSVVVHPGVLLENPMVANRQAVDAIRGKVSANLSLLPLFAGGGVVWHPYPRPVRMPDRFPVELSDLCPVGAGY